MASSNEPPSPLPDATINISTPDNEISSPPTAADALPTAKSENHETVVGIFTNSKIQTNGAVQEKTKQTLKTDQKNDSASFWMMTAFLFYVLLFILFVLIFFSLPSKPSSSKDSQLENLQNRSLLPVKTTVHCITASCLAASQSIASSIDFGADPCMDFYNYSCGNWPKVNEEAIKKQRTYLVDSNLVLLAVKVNSQLKELLSNSNISSSTNAKSVSLAGELYRQCLDWREETTAENFTDFTFFEPLRQEIKFIFGGADWPIFEPSEHAELGFSTNDTVSSSTIVQKALVEAVIRLIQLDLNPLVEFFIDVNLNNRSGDPRFYFTVPDTIKEDRPLFADPNTYKHQLSRRRKINRSAMKTFLHFQRQQQHNSNEISNQAQNDSIWENNTISERLMEVFTLEAELALATSPPEESKSTVKSLKWMSLRQMKKELQGNSNNSTFKNQHPFDWSLFLEVFNGLFDMKMDNITEDTVVGVGDTAFFRQLPEILARTPMYVLFNYLGVKLVDKYYRHHEAIGASSENWCLDLITGQLDQAVSRLYIEGQLGVQAAKETKRQAEEMVVKMRRSFRQILATDTNWLDKETRVRALEKEAATQYLTAYPDWILDDQALDEHYGLDENSAILEKIKIGNDDKNDKKENHFFDAVLALKRHRVVTFAAKRKGFLSRSIKTGASNINAFAVLYTNEIVLPLAILQPPLFDTGRPAYLNIASLGSIIGHEAVHHFDYNGREFTADGSLLAKGTSWWSKETAEHFETAAQCFVQQYDQVVDQWTGKRLKGNATLGENMADQGAINVAYWAAFGGRDGNATETEIELLPGKLETFTPEQLFFVAYAQTYCTHYHGKEILSYQIDSDLHSPARYRVDLSLASFAPFSAAFHCPTEGPRSKMNAAKNRCN